MKIKTVARIKPGVDYYKIQPTDSADLKLFAQLMEKRKNEAPVYVTIELPERRRTDDQLRTSWKLVSVIYESMNGDKGTSEDLYSLYLDLLDVYAKRVPNKLNGGSRPVHVSSEDPDCTVSTAAFFIEGLMLHLSEFCELKIDAQTEVRALLTQWISWRGTLDDDPLDDYSEDEWRLRHPYSEASGLSGPIQRAHIVSRGTDQADIEAPWNWIALTDSEHRLQHEAGWEAFLSKFPHLEGRVNRARRKAKKLGVYGE